MEFGLIIFSAFIGSLAFCLGCMNLIEVKAMQKSTHSIQYVPFDEKKNKLMSDEELSFAVTDPEDDEMLI